MLAATWVTAIATVGLLLGAIVTAWYAAKTFATQAKQLKLLELQQRDEQALTRQQSTILDLQARQMRQILEERDAQALQDRWSQAERVMVWQTRDAVGPGPGHDTPWGVSAHIDNRSDGPVTGVSFRFHGDGIRTVIDRPESLAPGQQATGAMKAYAPVNATVYFRDPKGILWQRDAASGKLAEVPPEQ